jgi:L-fuculose-phosphate aldolase
MMRNYTEKEDVAYFMRRLYDRFLTTASGGNISLKASEEDVLITPASLDKGIIAAEQIAVVTMNGENLTQDFKPSIETTMHLEIYKKRSDIMAVIHAHPVYASLFTTISRKVNTHLIAEARYMLGTPAVAKYELMGTNELAQVVAEASLKSNVILLKNHGVLTIGATLLEAFDRMEVLENCAKMTFLTELLQEKQEMTPEQIAAIDALR